MKKAYFQYYETFEKVVQKFKTAEERESIREKIISYGLYGVEPENLTPAEDMVWDIVKDMIDDQYHRREVNRDNRKKKTAEQEPEQKEELEVTAEEEKTERKTKKFIKPTTEEVAAYCEERNNSVSAQQFCDYYEARGGKVGNAPMKDWKAAVRTWEQRSQTPVYNNSGGYKQQYSLEDKLTL